MAIKLHNKLHHHIKNVEKFKSFRMEQSCFLLQVYISLGAENSSLKILQMGGYLSCATLSTVNVNTFT
jgi:hypothetical protein